MMIEEVTVASAGLNFLVQISWAREDAVRALSHSALHTLSAYALGNSRHISLPH